MFGVTEGRLGVRLRLARLRPGGQDPSGAPEPDAHRCRGQLLAAGVGLALGALALGPGLARGFLLSYDMVFEPSPPFSTALLGITGGPARAVPSDAVIAVLGHLMPADVLQKIVLLSIFVGACAGAATLLAGGWRQATGKRAPLLACLAAGVFYAWNPYVAERLLIGQWALLLGYAGLPWLLHHLCTGPARARPGVLLLAMVPAAVGGFAAMTVTGLAAVPVALARGTRRERRRRLVLVLLALLVLSLPWLIPSLLVPVRTDPLGVDLFAARADTPLGRLGSLVLLSGIWNAQTVPRGYGGIGTLAWLLVVATGLAGYFVPVVRRAWARLGWPGLGLAGLLGLAVAAIGITSVTRAALRDLVGAWPGFAVLRDGQQFVAPLGLTEAVGLGVAVAWFLGRATVPAARGRGGPGRRQTEPAAVAVAVLILIAPVLLLPGMAWGEFGRLRPVQYPADWLVARQIIDSSRSSGSVLVLPWGAYRRYPWNHDEVVYDPWNKLLSREVVSDDGVQVGDKALPPESAASTRISRILASHGALSGSLRAAGVRYVVIDAGPLLGKSAADVVTGARLPGARTVLASRDLIVLQLPSPAERRE